MFIDTKRDLSFSWLPAAQAEDLISVAGDARRQLSKNSAQHHSFLGPLARYRPTVVDELLDIARVES
jgi:hypothetical protein